MDEIELVIQILRLLSLKRFRSQLAKLRDKQPEKYRVVVDFFTDIQ